MRNFQFSKNATSLSTEHEVVVSPSVPLGVQGAVAELGFAGFKTTDVLKQFASRAGRDHRALGKLEHLSVRRTARESDGTGVQQSGVGPLQEGLQGRGSRVRLEVDLGLLQGQLGLG